MTNKADRILVSGIKPTGALHIGNYFGAIKQFVELQEEYKSYVFIADFHAITTLQNGKELSENTLEIATDYLAVGLDPKKVTLYKQSDLPEVTELAWIFNCLTTVPYLMRAHAFKDAQVKNKEVNTGIFTYPLLMAADILIQQADVVPVGADQKQHIEIARDTAQKFNRIFGEILHVPEPLIVENTQAIPGTDGQKMSKSYKNTIGLFASNGEIKEAVMKIPTDSRGVEESKEPNSDNVFALHKFFTEGDEFEDLKERYENGGIGYQESKEILTKNIINFVAPFREKRDELRKDKDYVLGVLDDGAKRARERATKVMEEVREVVGIKFN